MRDIVGHLLEPLQQLLDAIEHGVEIGGKGIELVIAPRHRHALAEIARHDLGRGLLDGIDPPQDAPRGDAPGDDREQDDPDHASEEALQDDGRIAPAFDDVATDHQAHAIAQLDRADHRDALALAFRTIRPRLDRGRLIAQRIGPFIVEAIYAGLDDHFGGNIGDVAEQIEAGCVAKKVDPRPWLGGQAVDGKGQRANALIGLDALEQANFAIDVVGLLALDLHAGLPADEAHQQNGKDHEDGNEGDGQADG